jgi:hypothetical protein
VAAVSNRHASDDFKAGSVRGTGFFVIGFRRLARVLRLDSDREMKIEIPQPLESRARKLLLITCAMFIPVMGLFGWFWFAEQIDWFSYIDLPLHLIGGLVSALCFLLFIAVLHGNVVMRQIPQWMRCLLVLSFTALVTIAWEFFENFTDTFLGTQLQSTVFETLKDMAVGLIGALPVAAWLGSNRSFADHDDGEG